MHKTAIALALVLASGLAADAQFAIFQAASSTPSNVLTLEDGTVLTLEDGSVLTLQ